MPSLLPLLRSSLAAAVLASSVELPGGSGGIGFDDLVYSPELRRVLAPAGGTGLLDLVDPATGAVESIGGFGRRDPSPGGHGEGTTSADFGLGTLFATDRSRGALAAVDPAERRIAAEVRLQGPPDYVRWVGPFCARSG